MEAGVCDEQQPLLGAVVELDPGHQHVWVRDGAGQLRRHIEAGRQFVDSAVNVLFEF